MSTTSILSNDSGSTSLTKINGNFQDLNTSLTTGAASSTDNAIVRFDGITGKIVQNSGLNLGDLSTAVTVFPSDKAGVGYGLNLVAGNSTSDDGGVLYLRAGNATSGNKAGGLLQTNGGEGFGSQSGGANEMIGGPGGATGEGGYAYTRGGAGGATSGAGGKAFLMGGAGTNGNANGGDVILRPGLKNGSGANGLIYLSQAAGSLNAILDVASIASTNKTFTFPNETGTIPVGVPWTTWTPTWSGLSLGNGVVTAQYTQIGKTVFCRLGVVFGTTTTFSAVFTASLPVTAVSGDPIFCGTAYLEDAGSQGYVASVKLDATTSVKLSVGGSGGTYVTANDVSNTVPFTWATGDFIRTYFFYQAA